MKNRKLISRFALFLLLWVSLLSFSTYYLGINYHTLSDCEAHEGAGNCSACDGGYHSTAGCCLLTAVKEGDSKAIKKYTDIIKGGYQKLKAEADKATLSYENLKKKKASSPVLAAAQKKAAEATRKATKSKAELDELLGIKKKN